MRAWIVALSVLGLVVTATAAKADRRVALVIGNGAYKNMQSLANPPADAEAMAKLLKSIDFEVIEGTDLTRDQMNERILEFGKKSDGADLAVFYYAGHSITLSGASYLAAVDAQFKSEMDIKLGHMVDLSSAIEETMANAKIKLVFFDASRENPFKSSSQTGLAGKIHEGLLIELATGPGKIASDGQQGAHSPFTRALLVNIARPGVDIQQAMTRVRAQVNEETNKAQLPVSYDYLVGAVYLNPTTASSGAPKSAK